MVVSAASKNETKRHILLFSWHSKGQSHAWNQPKLAGISFVFNDNDATVAATKESDKKRQFAMPRFVILLLRGGQCSSPEFLPSELQKMKKSTAPNIYRALPKFRFMGMFVQDPLAH
jgi:hypothetical protein